MNRARGWTGPTLGLVLLVSCGFVAGCGEDRPSGAVARGEAIAEDVGCMACHSTGTDAKIGPGWGEIWGTEVELADGRTVTVDEDYLRRAITDPGADVVSGFQLAMPRVPLSDEEVEALTAYLRWVSGDESVSGGGS
jgi:cytochrome c oxidase subunit 2